MATSVFLLGLGGWFVLNCVSIVGYYSDSAFRKDDYREAAAVLSGYSVPTFVVAGQPLLLQRYGAWPRDATSATPGNLREFIRSHSGGAPQVVLLFNQFRNYRWASTDRSPAQMMSPEYDCKTARHLANIDIYVCSYLPHGVQSSPGAAAETALFIQRGAGFDGPRSEIRMQRRGLGNLSAQ
jgi:hypothetical protein